MYVIELGVMMLLGLVVLFMVVRPLVKRIIASETMPSPADQGLMPALSDGGTPPAAATGQSLVPSPNATSQMIDVAQIQGQVHAQSVHRVGALAEQNPNETASIIRQWLSEPA
jgi:flagellar M-ring protein FliF